MTFGNHRASSPARLLMGMLLALSAGMVACASSQPVQTPKTGFNGTWSAKWCDPEHPKSECGNFVLHLVQRGERICGQHFAATPRLSKLEEGEPGSVLGASVGDAAVLLINNSRSGERNIATVTITPKGLQWHVIGVAIPGERPWDSIIGGDWVLNKDTSESAISAWRELNESPCQWPDEIPPKNSESP